MYKFHIKSTVDFNKDKIKESLLNFNNTGENFVIGNRNIIKLVEIDGRSFLIKSFKVPHTFNKIIYRYFRKSKAERSFENAEILTQKGIGTPSPIAYLEKYDLLGIRESYFAYEYIKTDLTFAKVSQPEFPDFENILRQFTQFTFKLHESGIEFLDHSAGNTLIANEGNGKYSFYLIDLNRMNFHSKIDLNKRMKNLSRLTPVKNVLQLMSNEYAKLSGLDRTFVFTTLWKYTQEFQNSFERKRRFKNKLKFWKFSNPLFLLMTYVFGFYAFDKSFSFAFFLVETISE